MADEIFELNGKVTLDTTGAEAAIRKLNSTLSKIGTATASGKSSATNIFTDIKEACQCRKY